MKPASLLAASAVAFLLAGCGSVPNPMQGFADPSPRARAAEVDPVPGTAFIFDDGRVERFLRRDGETLVWATRRGREYVRAANPALPILSWEIGERSGRREVFGDTGDIWPPANGSRAQFRVLTEIRDGEEQRRYSQAWTCQVDGPKAVTVPAGAFPAWRITCERFSVNSMQLLERRTWWWSEDLGHYVRRRYQDLRNGEASDIALCAALPELRASEARIEALLEAC